MSSGVEVFSQTLERLGSLNAYDWYPLVPVTADEEMIVEVWARRWLSAHLPSVYHYAMYAAMPYPKDDESIDGWSARDMSLLRTRIAHCGNNMMAKTMAVEGYGDVVADIIGLPLHPEVIATEAIDDMVADTLPHRATAVVFAHGVADGEEWHAETANRRGEYRGDGYCWTLFFRADVRQALRDRVPSPCLTMEAIAALFEGGQPLAIEPLLIKRVALGYAHVQLAYGNKRGRLPAVSIAALRMGAGSFAPGGPFHGAKIGADSTADMKEIDEAWDAVEEGDEEVEEGYVNVTDDAAAVMRGAWMSAQGFAAVVKSALSESFFKQAQRDTLLRTISDSMSHDVVSPVERFPAVGAYIDLSVGTWPRLLQQLNMAVQYKDGAKDIKRKQGYEETGETREADYADTVVSFYKGLARAMTLVVRGVGLENRESFERRYGLKWVGFTYPSPRHYYERYTPLAEALQVAPWFTEASVANLSVQLASLSANLAEGRSSILTQMRAAMVPAPYGRTKVPVVRKYGGYVCVYSGDWPSKLASLGLVGSSSDGGKDDKYKVGQKLSTEAHRDDANDRLVSFGNTRRRIEEELRDLPGFYRSLSDYAMRLKLTRPGVAADVGRGAVRQDSPRHPGGGLPFRRGERREVRDDDDDDLYADPDAGLQEVGARGVGRDAGRVPIAIRRLSRPHIAGHAVVTPSTGRVRLADLVARGRELDDQSSELEHRYSELLGLSDDLLRDKRRADRIRNMVANDATLGTWSIEARNGELNVHALIPVLTMTSAQLTGVDDASAILEQDDRTLRELLRESHKASAGHLPSAEAFLSVPHTPMTSVGPAGMRSYYKIFKDDGSVKQPETEATTVAADVGKQ